MRDDVLGSLDDVASAAAAAALDASAAMVYWIRALCRCRACAIHVGIGATARRIAKSWRSELLTVTWKCQKIPYPHSADFHTPPHM